LTQSSGDLEYQFYEQFFFSRDLEPYPIQEQALGKIFAGDNVMVTVPTGTGKTLIAKAALFKALQKGQRAIYTTPLRALTEEKHRELVADFGADKVGFATGDVKVNPEAPLQVVVAEILWNQIFGNRGRPPADVVVMDEVHYFNDMERGYVWEQSIVGMHPTTQLVLLSATIGYAAQFCHWAELSRRVPMQLIESRERRVPLYHQYREEYLIEVVRDLAHKGEVPAIIFVFGREKCFETARVLKSCRRFTTDEEKQRIEETCKKVLFHAGVARELQALLIHGIGIHHAGILPRYKQMVEMLTLERLIKFVVSTETISAGINLPAKRVIFPELKKYLRSVPRLVTAAEFHQMAGRAGRPQYDSEGIAIALAPEAVVQEVRKEMKSGRGEEDKIKKSVYARLKAEARKNNDVLWDYEAHQALVHGEPAPLTSHTQITAEMVLAIGLPDLEVETLEATSPEPPALHLNIKTVVDHLLLDPNQRRETQKRLTQVAANLQALGIVDAHGQQIAGDMIRNIRGIDGLFVYYALLHHTFDYLEAREFVEFLVEHEAIMRILSRKVLEARRDWIKQKLREVREENPQVSWEDVEEMYDREFPRQLTRIEQIHSEFTGKLPHPELHGGKEAKTIWARIEDEELSFFDFVEREGLAHEEGSLFTYLARLRKAAQILHEATTLEVFSDLQRRVASRLAVVDDRIDAE
jgi:hypothetical protein